MIETLEAPTESPSLPLLIEEVSPPDTMPETMPDESPHPTKDTTLSDAIDGDAAELIDDDAIPVNDEPPPLKVPVEGADVAAVLAKTADWHAAPSDVLAFLKSLPDKSVDLIFSSPPYDGKARRYGSGENLRAEAWVSWMVEVYTESLRVCRGLVAYVVDGATREYRWSATPVLLQADLHRRGVALRKPPCYVRNGIPGSGGRDWWKNNWEFVICATAVAGPLPWSDNLACGHEPKYKRSGPFSNRRPNGVRNRRAYTPPSLANPGNVIQCKVGGGQMGSSLAHENEAPFPEFLAERFVRSFCPPDGIVLDPFVGSGTTAAVSLRWGRRFIGCDERIGQIDLTRRRVGEPFAPPSPAVPRTPTVKPGPVNSGTGTPASGTTPAATRRRIPKLALLPKGPGLTAPDMPVCDFTDPASEPMPDGWYADAAISASKAA